MSQMRGLSSERSSVIIKKSGCTSSTVCKIELSSSSTPTISMSGWSEIVATTSSLINRGRFATSTLIFCTTHLIAQYPPECKEDKVQLSTASQRTTMQTRWVHLYLLANKKY